MKAYLFIAEDGEAARQLVKQAGERGVEVQVMTGDTEESVHLREVYDVVMRPAMLVTRDDGSYVRMWQGALPNAAELAYTVQGR